MEIARDYQGVCWVLSVREEVEMRGDSAVALSVVQCGTVWCSVVQCVAVCCSVFTWVLPGAIKGYVGY